MKDKKVCKKTVGKLNAFLDKELPQEEMVFFSEHLLSCAECRAEFDSIKQVNEMLSAYKPEPMPEIIRTKLLLIPQKERANGKVKTFIRRIAPVPAAAALLLTMFFSLILGRTFLNYQNELFADQDSYQLAQESFYTVWEDIGNE